MRSNQIATFEPNPSQIPESQPERLDEPNPSQIPQSQPEMGALLSVSACRCQPEEEEEEEEAEDASDDEALATKEYPVFHTQVVMGDPAWAVIPMGEPATLPPYHGTPFRDTWLKATPVTM